MAASPAGSSAWVSDWLRTSCPAAGRRIFRYGGLATAAIRRSAILAGLILPLAACDDFPKDSNGTVERIRAGAPLRVGWTEAEPWVRRNRGPEPAGLEPDLIRAWAETMQMRLEWVTGSEAQLVRALEGNATDVAIGGFSTDTPWGGRTGQTQPYLETSVVVGVAPDTPEPGSWRDVEIRYARSRPHFAALIAGLGARPIAAEPGQLFPIGAAYASELRELGLKPTKTVLAEESRIMATAPAENALTLALDRFLHTQKATAEIRDR